MSTIPQDHSTATERVFTASDVERLGIQLPAESFAELVRLAVIGHEVDGDQ